MSIEKRRDHITRIRWQAQEIKRAARLIGAIQVKTNLDKSVADAISTTVTEAYFQLEGIADEIQESIQKEQPKNA